MSNASISFTVPTKLWEDFKGQTNALFLNRGPFLAHMLSVELPELRQDLQGLKLSLRAKRHISGALKKTSPLTPNVNIEVRADTADLLRAIVKEHNLVRDAFFCRLLVFLRSKDDLLNRLDVPLYATDRGLKGMLEEMPASPMRAMEAIRDDPLFYIREHVRQVHGCGLYRVLLPWHQLHCYIEDEYIPGTRAHKRMDKLMQAL